MHQFPNDGTVSSIEGKKVKVRGDGILAHSDTLGAIELAALSAKQSRRAGGIVTTTSEIVA